MLRLSASERVWKACARDWPRLAEMSSDEQRLAETVWKACAMRWKAEVEPKKKKETAGEIWGDMGRCGERWGEI